MEECRRRNSERQVEIRSAYVLNVWEERTGRMRVVRDGEGSKSLERRVDWDVWGREGIVEGGGRV